LPEEKKTEKAKDLQIKSDLGDYTPIKKWTLVQGAKKVKETVTSEQEGRDSKG
jgi:hypothetical protein